MIGFMFQDVVRLPISLSSATETWRGEKRDGQSIMTAVFWNEHTLKKHTRNSVRLTSSRGGF